MDDFDRAVALALEAHYGQTDKTGRPYFEHCQRVALRLGPTADANLRIVAYLHDVPEKAPG
jgi:(p)ppGpp synthase/HD superfamily hydrolase